MAPRYSPTDEPDKLDSEPIEAAAPAPAQQPAVVEETEQSEDPAKD